MTPRTTSARELALRLLREYGLIEKGGRSASTTLAGWLANASGCP